MEDENVDLAINTQLEPADQTLTIEEDILSEETGQEPDLTDVIAEVESIEAVKLTEKIDAILEIVRDDVPAGKGPETMEEGVNIIEQAKITPSL